jgi:hypothetical protein
MKVLAVAGVLGLVLSGALVAFAPAALVDARLAAATRGQVRLAGAEGTLWHGRGTAVIGDDTARVPVAWRLEPWPLLRGEARIALEPAADEVGAPRGSVTLGWGRTQVDALAWSLPAGAFAAVAPMPGLAAGGVIDVRVEGLAYADRIERGSVRIEWRNARLAMAGQPALALGTVAAALSARDGGLSGPLTARDGSIRIDGDATLAPGSARLGARLVPTPSAGAAERAALAKLGTPAADGSVSLSLAGALPR